MNNFGTGISKPSASSASPVHQQRPPAVQPRDLSLSPTLSILKKTPSTLQGRKIGVLITDGFDGALLATLRKAASKEKASLMVVAPKVGGATDAEGTLVEADAPISGAPSVIFDTVALLLSAEGAQDLATLSSGLDWVSNAFAHLKIIAPPPPSPS